MQMKILTLISAWARVGGWGWGCVCTRACVFVREGGLPSLSRRVFGDEDCDDDDGVCAALTLCVTPAFPVSDVDMSVGKITSLLHQTVL